MSVLRASRQCASPEAQIPGSRHYRELWIAWLTHIIHEASTAAADPGMPAALRSVGLLDVLSSTLAEPSVARLESMPVCAASLQTFMNNAG